MAAFSGALRCEKAPSPMLAFTNRVYLHATDFAAYKGAAPPQGMAADCVLLELTNEQGTQLVYAASAHATVQAGTCGLSGPQRSALSLELSAPTRAAPFRPTLATQLASIRLSCSPQKKAPLTIDAAQLCLHFEKENCGQVFCKGQRFPFALDKKSGMWLTVEGLDFNDGSSQTFGQYVKGVTKVLPFRGPGCDPSFRLEGEPVEARGEVKQQSLFTSDFDFAKLGIGGLGAEFDTIFRSAFASRIYPTHIIQQMGISHVRGMLLYGPPGCGKTLIARQIGKVLNAREPKIVNGPEILDKYVGASEEKIRELFADAEAEQQAEGDRSMLHTIIFDEMDAICKSRGSVRDGTGVSDSVVNQLLSKIDGVDSLNNILIIGMTNRKDMIDEALLRPGRLELHVEIGLPDEAGRLQILDIKTSSMRKSGRLQQDAIDGLPTFAENTQNFSGAELEGLVKAAASYALRRCVDVAGDNAIDEAALKVTRHDFEHALDSGEACAAFGAKAALLKPLYRNGIVDFGASFRDTDDALKRLVEQVRTSAKTPLMTVLLEGKNHTGKTALAARTAVASDFPFIRLLSADAMIGFSESAKCQTIQKVFLDSYKSPLSIIVIDDVERLIEYTPVGPRFSNTILQTLWVLLKKAPPLNRLLVVATTAVIRHLEDLQLVDAFNVSLRCPQLETPEEIEAALADLVSDGQQRAAIARAVTTPLGIKQLLMVLEMARDARGGGDANDFAACLHQFLGV